MLAKLGDLFANHVACNIATLGLLVRCQSGPGAAADKAPSRAALCLACTMSFGMPHPQMSSDFLVRGRANQSAYLRKVGGRRVIRCRSFHQFA